MIGLIISGGQTGADQAGWRAAKAAGIPTGGWMPKYFRTEGKVGPNGRPGPDERHPEFADLYGAKEHEKIAYPFRTRDNVRSADVTVVFDASGGRKLTELSRGSQLAINSAVEYGVPSITVFVNPSELGDPVLPSRPQAMAGRITERGYRSVNVAGNRESSAPGIGAWVEKYMREVFSLLGHKETEDAR